MISQSIFIAGIGTDVGKTIVSAVLCNILEWDYWKPIQTGSYSEHDRHFVSSCQTHNDFQIISESYAFDAPMSPHIAAKKEKSKIELDKIELTHHSSKVIVEGAGGIMVPIDYEGNTNINLMKKLKIAAIVVSRHYLGSINHTLLTMDKLKKEKIPILGIIYIGEEIDGTKEIIKKITGINTLMDIPIFDEPKVESIKSYCNAHKVLIQNIIKNELERIG